MRKGCGINIIVNYFSNRGEIYIEKFNVDASTEYMKTRVVVINSDKYAPIRVWKIPSKELTVTLLTKVFDILSMEPEILKKCVALISNKPWQVCCRPHVGIIRT